MAKNHIADRPVWFTESGCRLEGSGRLDSYMKGLKMHDPDQELLIAEFIPKMMISMQMLGVSRDFFFVLLPYNENDGKKDWGLMRRDFTVKAGFPAFATLVDQLGERRTGRGSRARQRFERLPLPAERQQPDSGLLELFRNRRRNSAPRPHRRGGVRTEIPAAALREIQRSGSLRDSVRD